MTDTANLGITLLESGQLQPDVSVNEGFQKVDDAWGTLPNLFAPRLLAINAQTGTSYTIGASDLGKLCTFSNGGAVTVTVPADSSEDLPIGFAVLIAQIGGGQVSVEGEDSNVTIIAPESLSLRKQGAQAALVKIDADTWLLDGNLETA